MSTELSAKSIISDNVVKTKSIRGQRTRATTSKTSTTNTESLGGTDNSNEKVQTLKRRKSVDVVKSEELATRRSTKRSTSNRNSRSSSRGRTTSTNTKTVTAPKLYTKKDMQAQSPAVTRSRRKTANNKSPQTQTTSPKQNEPEIIEIETIKTASFTTEEIDMVEKSPKKFNSNEDNVELVDKTSSENRFENDEIEDSKTRRINEQKMNKSFKEDEYAKSKTYESGYLRFTSWKIIRLVLITILFLIILAVLNNTKRIESLQILNKNCPLFKSVQNNVDYLTDYLRNVFYSSGNLI
ncbi:unnamed protein product [Brachionus calyciflorus]|uniref:Uncharacterized protein n=1 Tax=Brachionus calyciflorus TaxID=104777 RepID=A0A813TME0_9BILA|nr:unnamed protein product [Brachionus calyciflorus]